MLLPAGFRFVSWVLGLASLGWQGGAQPAADPSGHDADVTVAHVICPASCVGRLAAHEVGTVEHQNGIAVGRQIGFAVSNGIEGNGSWHSSPEPALPRIYVNHGYGFLLHQIPQFGGRDDLEPHESREHSLSSAF